MIPTTPTLQLAPSATVERPLAADLPISRADALDDDVVHLPEVARYLLDIVFVDPTRTTPSHRGLTWAAVRYGVSRRNLGQPLRTIDDEMNLLRTAAEQRIRRAVSDDEHRDQSLDLLGRAVEVATQAARLGYERDALRTAGRWDAELQRALKQHPFGPSLVIV